MKAYVLAALLGTMSAVQIQEAVKVESAVDKEMEEMCKDYENIELSDETHENNLANIKAEAATDADLKNDSDSDDASSDEDEISDSGSDSDDENV